MIPYPYHDPDHLQIYRIPTPSVVVQENTTVRSVINHRGKNEVGLHHMRQCVNVYVFVLAPERPQGGRWENEPPHRSQLNNNNNNNNNNLCYTVVGVVVVLPYSGVVVLRYVYVNVLLSMCVCMCVYARVWLWLCGYVCMRCYDRVVVWLRGCTFVCVYVVGCLCDVRLVGVVVCVRMLMCMCMCIPLYIYMFFLYYMLLRQLRSFFCFVMHLPSH